MASHPQSPDSNSPKYRFKLQTVLSLPFALQVTAIVGLTGYLSVRNAERAVDDSASRLLDKTEQLVRQHLDSFLALPHQLNAINSEAVKRGRINLQDTQDSAHYFWQQAQQFPQLSFVGYNLGDNTTAGAGRQPTHPGISAILQPPGAQSQYTIRKIDAGGNIGAIVEKNPLTVAEQPWYADTVKAGKPVWTQIYTLPNTPGFIAASANRPIFARNGKIIGVLGADIQLAELSRFLKGINVSSGTRIAIIERNGFLVASSEREPVFFIDKNETKRWTILNYPHSVLSEISRSLQQQNIILSSSQTPQRLQHSLGGEKYYISALPWQDRYGLDWLAIVSIPKSDFAGTIEANMRTTLLLCAIALFLALLSGWLTAHWIARPILTLKKASAAIAEGSSQGAIEQQIPSNRILEIDSVGQAFARMTDKLQHSFAALENINRELEDRVAERTQELSDKNQQLLTALTDLRATQARVIQAEKMSALGEMVAGVAHEINNPVNFIHGNLNYLQDYLTDLLDLLKLYDQTFPESSSTIQGRVEEIDLEFLRTDSARIIHSMQTGTERIRDIVLSLRNFSGLDRTGVKPLDLHEGLANALAIVAYRLAATELRPEIEIERKFSLQRPIECYSSQLNQVFLHLLNNAIDAIDEYFQQAPIARSRQPRVVLQTEQRGDRARLEIRDNGRGMSEEVQQHIFDPFFTTKPVGKGTGLGLTTAYQIVTELHGGELSCDSILGEGTCFAIEIPFLQRAELEG